MKTGPGGRVFVAYSPQLGLVWWTRPGMRSSRGDRFLRARTGTVRRYASKPAKSPETNAWRWLRDCLGEALAMALADDFES